MQQIKTQNSIKTPKERKLFLGLLYWISFFAVFCFILWKCRYGFANVDEAFYLTVPYRLCRGDNLLLHEWHVSQLSGFLLYPAVRLYLLINGSTEGIFLFFRYLFVFVWTTASVFIYIRLRAFSQTGSKLAALALLIYAPYGIMALSYNSLGIICLLSSCSIIATAKSHLRLSYLFSGLLFAGAVLCCPHLLILYLGFTIVSVCFMVKHKKGAFLLWLWNSIGCLILLILFCVFLFSRHATLKDILSVLPLILNDPKHTQPSFFQHLITFFLSIINCNDFSPYCLALLLVVILFSVLKKEKTLCLITTCILCLIIGLGFYKEIYPNYLMFPIGLVAPFCALNCKDEKVRVPFFAVWLPGLIYSMCIFWSSNQRFYAVSNASTVMAVSGIVILFAAFPNLVEMKTPVMIKSFVCVITAALLLIMQFTGELYARYSCVQWESGGMEAQTVAADSGAEKGIIMTQPQRDYYYQMSDDVSYIKNRSKIRKVLFFSNNTILYIMAELDMATYSAWLSGVNQNSLDRLDQYYELFPDKRPDGIYVNTMFEEYIDHFIKQGYRKELLPSGAYFLTKTSDEKE